MFSSRVCSVGSKAAVLFVALSASCSAASSNPDAPPGIGGAQGTTRGSAGASAGASGQAAVSGGAGGMNSSGGSTGGAAQGGNAAGTRSTTPSGSSGSMPQPGNVAGVSGATATAGGGGQSGTGATAGATAATGGSAGAAGSSSPVAGCEVSPVTADMRSRYQNMNDEYYTKYASANEVIVATGAGVDDEAVVRYCRLLTEMVSNEAVRQAIIRDKMWFTMIAEDEQLSSLPQIDRQYGTSLDRRARGLGGLTPTICAQDSIMCMPGDKWKGDCICPHEAGHTLYSSGIAKVSELSSRLSSITDSARSSGRLANAYVWQDGNESGMMAWGVQVWYNCAINGTNGAYHSDINTRAELEKDLPDFHKFLSELLPADNEYKDCYAKP
jgi:hypothetical protein